eukprot:TRINITY_DN21992_c0_g1_i1.p1 TRINITY_DN21992_c0_g1~~TRINITY_DN21992_c0_g1_i1.p1  ORF type:complete len:135 (+),score=40.80 TRINITY_DN21992_c0_g1_i1:104-508(+)
MLHLKSSINWLLTLAGVLGCGAILAGLAGADHDLLTINVISLFALFITGFLLVSLTDGIPSVSNSLAGAIVLQCLCAFAIAYTINSDILYILLVIIAGQIPFIFKLNCRVSCIGTHVLCVDTGRSSETAKAHRG